MGIEYALVDDVNKRYAHLGKTTWDDSGPVSFQIDPRKVMKFIVRAGGPLRLVPDDGPGWDEIMDKHYSLVAEWCERGPGDSSVSEVVPYEEDEDS